MKTRKIHTKIWRDGWFCDLSSSSKLVFMYLISNEYMGLSGYAEIPDRVICFEVGITSKELEKVKKELSPKVLFSNDWVRIVNLLKHDPIRGEKNTLLIALQKEIDAIPDETKKELDVPSMPHQSSNDGRNGIGKGIGKGKEGGVGETFSTLESLTQEVLNRLAQEMQVSVTTVGKKKLELEGYCQSTGKKYKDYLATLRNWIRRDLDKGSIQKQAMKTVLPDLPEISEEQRADNLRKIQEIKAKSFIKNVVKEK